MPEGVEVELVRRGLEPAVGARILSVEFSAADHLLRYHLDGQSLAHVDPSRALPGALISDSDRVGKHLLFSLSHPHPGVPRRLTLGIHLGMSGVLTLDPPASPPPAWTRLRLLLRPSGRRFLELRFTDPRAFGYVAVSDDAAVGPWASAGVDVLSHPPRVLAAAWLGAVGASRRPIKEVLLDQRFVAGVGNIYADEALFAARLHPLTPASALSTEDWALLARAVRRVMLAALKRGGSTLSDGAWYRPDGSQGSAVFHHKVYARHHQPCLRCTTPISRLLVSGRSSHFCPSCQPAAAN